MSMAIVDIHTSQYVCSPHIPTDFPLKIKIRTANQNLPLFENLLLKRIDYNKKIKKNYKEMEDQINANTILHSSAIYIQSMKITRSICKTLLLIKSVNVFTPSI